MEPGIFRMQQQGLFVIDDCNGAVVDSGFLNRKGTPTPKGDLPIYYFVYFFPKTEWIKKIVLPAAGLKPDTCKMAVKFAFITSSGLESPLFTCRTLTWNNINIVNVRLKLWYMSVWIDLRIINSEKFKRQKAITFRPSFPSWSIIQWQVRTLRFPQRASWWPIELRYWFKVTFVEHFKIFIPRWEIKIIFMIIPSAFVKLSLRKVRLNHQNDIFRNLIFTTSRSIFTGRNEVVAKVIFLHLSVIHSVHRGMYLVLGGCT